MKYFKYFLALCALSAGGPALAQTVSTYTEADGTVRNQIGVVIASTPDAGALSTYWSYAAAAGGIDNTSTAVTIKAAGGSGIRNYLRGLQVTTGGVAGDVELVIRDGAGGTVLFRTVVPFADFNITTVQTINFPVPLRGTANTLLEVATVAAMGGAVYVNAQGFTGP